MGGIGTNIESSAKGSDFVAGSNGELQFNDGGAFGSDSRLYFDKLEGRLDVSGKLRLPLTSNRFELSNWSTIYPYSSTPWRGIQHDSSGTGENWIGSHRFRVGYDGLNLRDAFFIAANADTSTSKIGVNTIAPTGQFEVNPDSGLNSRIVSKIGVLEVRGDGSVFSQKGDHLMKGNLLIGDDAGNNVTGIYNNFFGYQAGFSASTGNYNNIFGYRAGFSLTSGSSNTLFGHRAGHNLGSAVENTFFGGQAGFYTTGSGNTGMGYLAGFELTTGTYNSFFGYRAGRHTSTGADHTNGTYSIFIGMDSAPLADGETNQIVLGSNANGNGSNTATIGNTSLTDLFVGGDGAGINLKSPNGTNYRLTVSDAGALVIT